MQVPLGDVKNGVERDFHRNKTNLIIFLNGILQYYIIAMLKLQVPPLVMQLKSQK